MVKVKNPTPCSSTPPPLPSLPRRFTNTCAGFPEDIEMDKGAGKESSGHALNVPNEEADNVSKLSSDAKADELYPGSTTSRTAFVEGLLKIKSSGGWTDKSIDMLLPLLIDLFPKGNTIPRSHDEAIKIIQNSDINKGPKADHVLSPGSCPCGKDSGRNAGSNEAGPSSTSSSSMGKRNKKSGKRNKK